MSDTSHNTARNERGGLFDRLRALFGAQQTSIRDNIEDALDEAGESEFTTQERNMLRSVLGLHELSARDIMVPRSDIIAISTQDSIGRLLYLFRTAGHSRLPVYVESLDAPQGMVHIRDFLELIARLAGVPAATPEQGTTTAGQTPEALGKIDLSAALPVEQVLRPVLFVPPSMPILDLLVRMQSERTHMALVIDEYGGTDGLVSIEDVVEAIVGDIEDEHDAEEAPQIAAVDDGFEIDGRAPLDQAISITGVDFRMAGDTEDIDTVAGLVSMLAGRIPETGEAVKFSGNIWEFEILEADRRRIKRVKLKKCEVA